MRIAGIYSLKNGETETRTRFAAELGEIETILSAVDATQFKTKQSKEKTMPGRMLYNPKALNLALKFEFVQLGWASQKVDCEYPTQYYTGGYTPPPRLRREKPFREMDFIKNRLGVEVQFGKYAFMVYNVCAKMTIFRNLNFIDVGVEIVPVKAFADEMSTGVSYFEQFVWDLEQRGVSDIDIPVLVLGIV